jgi:hypothetical protein
MKIIVIVDIDWTISNVGDRKKYIEKYPKDLDSFFKTTNEDTPIIEMVELIQNLSFFYYIIFCTGRHELLRDETECWLKKYLQIQSEYIVLMRKNGDMRHDVVVKPELIRKYGIDFNSIAFVLEDRTCMVKAYREMGLLVLQVADYDQLNRY